MRILLTIPLLLAGACNVERDQGNDTTAITINEAAIENTADDVGNTVENIASDVGNEAQDLGNRIDNTDVDVNVDTNTADNNKTN